MIGLLGPAGTVWSCLPANSLQIKPLTPNCHYAHVPNIQQLKYQGDPVNTTGITLKNLTREKMLPMAKDVTFCWIGLVCHYWSQKPISLWRYLLNISTEGE